MIGYDRLNLEILMDLQMKEAVGTATFSWAKPRQEYTLNGVPTWVQLANGQPYLNFVPGNPDYIDCPAADTTDLNFTSGDFSGVAWIYTAVGGNRYVFSKSTATAGWDFYLNTDDRMSILTIQAGPTLQSTQGDVIPVDTWLLVGFTRSGAAAAVYTNGEDTTAVVGTHVNPVTAVAVDMTLGSTPAGAAGWWSGRIAQARIWGRQLAAAEMALIFERERAFFGV